MPVVPEGPAGARPSVGAVVGVGIDLVEVARMRAALERTPSMVARVFTDDEATDAGRGGDRAERLAARFAAKEAVLKALGSGLGSVPMTSIEVCRAESGAPAVRLHGAAADLATRLGVGALQVSMTHTASTAGAVVVAVAGPDPRTAAGG